MTIASVTGTPTQTLRPCPQCQQMMSHLVLQGHQGKDVIVDHCAPCRLVWFDALESVQLSGRGWVQALRELQRGVRPEPAAQLLCPSCHVALKSVHNATRYGRFPALECPQGHGHLHSHSGMLAERGLVRPLLGPERQALAKERRTLMCLNCGAACDGSSQRCSYCATPLMVIDLPRLAHALRQRPGTSGPTRRRQTACPCRGRVAAAARRSIPAVRWRACRADMQWWHRRCSN